ncbi:DUF5988 family protein [Streptomyces sp. TLI_146]|uniref:DUF5988 family protein n=1 Tax=Streptomyces sp. TLI_146 TaxID=1938858 RepID=UPI000C6FDE9E|nr:DUF5988 family protein [Streptomyces sp. TLI_146]PKV83436.1 hypothetical protein BX283_0938 [Streptomyces sp. TLI_146]
MSNAAKAVLEGGPEELPERIVTLTEPDAQVKVPFRGGYEHFDPTERLKDTAEGQLKVYQWTYRTEIAE